MAVLIEGMEMPKSCKECKFWSITSCIASYQGEKSCPLIEVPEPHGRLIDKDALDIYQRAEAAYAEYQEDEDNLYLEGMANGLCEAAKQLSTARTIIHASKEG